MLLCVIDIYGKKALVVPLKDKKGITINNAIHTILDDSQGCKPNKIWKEKGLYNQSIKPWLQDNNKEYAMKNTQWKKKFIKTFKNTIYKYMSSVPQNVYIEKLNDIVGTYDVLYDRTVKTKPAYVKPGMCIEYDIQHNDKDPKFIVGDCVRISLYKSISGKGYNPNWSEEVFVMK